MGFSLRRIRLRAVWLLILPFLWFARPTPQLLLAGAGLALIGLAIRGWAAGVIRKEKELAVTGPYAFTRNPLYVGSFFLGLGVTVAGGQLAFVVLFAVFYLVVYGRTMGGEASLLENLFGDRYRHYARRVPLVRPRLTPYRPPEPVDGGFTLSRYLRNREWEALLGTLTAFAFLFARMRWGPGG